MIRNTWDMGICDCPPVFCLQQNKMSGTQATYQHQHLFSKNHRLYQQLLQEDIPAGSSSSHTQAATIRFAKPSTLPVIITNTTQQHSPEREEFSPRLPRSGGLFKGFQTRISNQATQSLSSNYCITEHENEENSTVNLYSFSRNHIEPDLDLSRTPTTPRDPTDSRHTSTHNTPTTPNTPNRPILEASLNPIQIPDDCSQSQRCDNNDVLEPYQLSRASVDIKQYRSEEYSQARQYEQQEEEQKQHVPKVLAEKYLRSDITRKFSQESEKEPHQGSFRTVLNEIHVVPYRINNQLRPYAYSLPVQARPKANSLHLRSSGISLQEEEPPAARPLYFSNHTHVVTRPTQVAQSETQIRPTPRSEPKYSYVGQRNRSNSIQCKSKPNISLQAEQRNPEHLEQSQVTKLFKNTAPIVLQDQQQESSVIYEAAGVNVCCGLSQPQANKINFMSRPRQPQREESPFFVSSIDMSRAVPLQPKASYKINPIQLIRELNQPESQRGIKLVGFPRRPS